MARNERALPEFALLAAILVAFGSLTGIGAGLVGAMAPWLPIDPSSIDPLDALTAVFTFAAVAVGIRRHKRLAWPIAILFFAGGAVSQALVLHHPIGAALALACLAVLLVNAGHYRARSSHGHRRVVVVVMTFGVAVLVIGSILVDLAASSAIGSPLDLAARWVTSVVSFTDPGTGAGTVTGTLVLNILEFLAQSTVLVAAVAVLAADPDRPLPSELERSRAAASRHVSGSLAPFQIGADKQLYADAEGLGVVAYGLAGRHAIVVGDPIGQERAAWGAFEAFEAQCHDGDVAVSVYQASSDGASRLKERGYRVFRVGMEATVDLATFSLAGSRRANLRHSVARAERGGIEARWYPDGLSPEQLGSQGDQLVEIDRQWSRPRGRTLHFTVGSFNPTELADVGTSVATAPGGQIAAFVTFRRMGPRGWVLDVLRRRDGADPGALELCIVHAMLGMRAAGADEVSLGLVALMGVSASGGSIEERAQAIGRFVVAARYNIAGLAFFKSKFDPEWVPRFGAVRGTFGFIGFATALLRLHLRIAVPMTSRTGPPAASAGTVARTPAGSGVVG